MKICLKCFEEFPVSVVVDGQRRNLQRRQFCFTCSPFGGHNTRKLADVTSTSGRRCPRCGETKQVSDFYNRRGGIGTGVYCKICTNDQTVERQRALKMAAVQYLGGCCAACGYGTCISALEFHHVDPTQKDFTVSKMHSRSLETVKEELAKCVLVCANCHREIHAGVRVCPPLGPA